MSTLRRQASRIIRKWEKVFAGLPDHALAGYTLQLRERKLKGEVSRDLLPVAFALVREAAWRMLGYCHNLEQLMAGIALWQGKLVEMKTGEGKTLAFTAPAYLAALDGRGVHLVTANEYLARRDCQTMGAIYNLLGVSCSVITSHNQFLYPPTQNDKYLAEQRISPLQPCSHREAYQAEITYGTAAAFGFDYLRDNLALRLDEQVQRPELAYIYLDEADNILLDEARTPLILTGPGCSQGTLYHRYMALIRELKKDLDYQVDRLKKSVFLTERGIDRLEKALGLTASGGQKGSLYDGNRDELYHIDNCLKALTLFNSPDDYLVIKQGQYLEPQANIITVGAVDECSSDLADEWEPHRQNLSERDISTGQKIKNTGINPSKIEYGQIILVDKNTGRPLPGRRLQHGLHDALEAREGLVVQSANVTRATISLQAYFNLYDHLAGMSGTLYHDRETFRRLYGLEVVRIPTHTPLRRLDMRPKVFRTQTEATAALIEDVVRVRLSGAPVLIGTTSVDQSEQVANLLASRQIPYRLLNARQTEYEAAIIARAGYPGRVTIATNMAGRGTDIRLGGSYESHLADILEERGLIAEVDRETQAWHSAIKDATERFQKAKEKAFQAGGLHVLGLGLQLSKRLEEQQIGRAGRQGDPGFSRFYLSLEDELLDQFTGYVVGRRISYLNKFKESAPYGSPVPINNRMANRIVEECQRKIEGQHHDSLKLGLALDRIFDRHRSLFYRKRQQILLAPEGVLVSYHRSNCNSGTQEEVELRYGLLDKIDQAWISYLNELDELKLGLGFQRVKGFGFIQEYGLIASSLFEQYITKLICETWWQR